MFTAMTLGTYGDLHVQGVGWCQTMLLQLEVVPAQAAIALQGLLPWT
jgi:hypothetical protein